MNLSHKLTFSLFSVLLIAAFILVATPAMAQTTVSAYLTETAATATAGEKIVLTLTYSDNPDPAPPISDFTAADNAISQPDDTAEDGTELRDVLTASYSDDSDNAITVARAVDGKTVTLTFTGPNNVDIALPSELQLRGYSTILATITATTLADAVNLAVMDGYIGGKTYVVYVRGTSATEITTPAPHLPANLETGGDLVAAANSQLVRTIDPTATSGNSNMAMPDLEDFFFVGGGTIDLNVEGTTKDSRHLIINEVMWALDDRLVGQDGHTSQQWIEVYNRLTTPAPAPTFVFTNNTSGLNPPAATAAGTSDRLSNIPSFTSTWNVKGQNGASTLNDASPAAINGADPIFKSMYRKTDKQNADGTNAGHWEVSNRPYLSGFHGTPGKVNTRGVVVDIGTVRPNPTAANPAMDKVLINEVFDATGNDANNKNDWIELRALKNTNLENWTLSYVNSSDITDNGADDEMEICRFPKRTITAGEIWLIVNTDPTADGVNLAPGNDITIPEADNRSPGRGDAKYLIVPDFEIPMAMGADALLILRSAKGWERFGSRDRLEDVIGPGTFEKKTRNLPTVQREPHSPKQNNQHQIWETKIFPLNGQNPGDYNKDKPDTLLENKWNFTPGTSWYRVGNNKGWLRDGGRHHGYQGGIGYDRDIPNTLAIGTPGYPNNAYKADGTDATANVIISEIMYAHDGTSQAPPQWIELYNPSASVAVNLHNFRLTITNHDQTMDADGMMTDWGGKGIASVLFGNNLSIPPKQTVLIVSATARRSEVSIPPHRIYNTFNRNKGEFGQKIRGDAILNPYGFNITLHAKGHEGDVNKRQLGDSIGNLADRRTGADKKNFEARETERFDAIRWTLPNPFDADKGRISIVRTNTVMSLKDAAGMNIDGHTRSIADGRMESGWMLSNADNRTERIDIVYYGNKADISTPGQTVGQPLPVALSFFRPTLENGKVTIQWTTESELDNAGFNILRSDTRNGEFTQVNEQMIQGKGTTAERSTYKWVDTTAKPGAVYYYQIEDVSYAGEHTKLATTKLKGLISAKGKLTTQWGELKNLR